MRSRVAEGMLLSVGLLCLAVFVYGQIFDVPREGATLVATARPESVVHEAVHVVQVPRREAESLVLSKILGSGTRTRGAEALPLEIGVQLDPEDTVETLAGSSLEFRSTSSDVVVSLAELGKLRVDEVKADRVVMTLETGRLNAKTEGHTVRVHGGLNRDTYAEAEEGIFNFQAEKNGVVRVAAIENKVTLIARNEQIEIIEGNEAMVDGGGRISHSRIPPRLLVNVKWPNKTEQRESSVIINGNTRPGSIVRSNGARQVVGRSGKIWLKVPLKNGDNVVRLRVEDISGRVRSLTSPTKIHVDNNPPELGDLSIIYDRAKR